MRVSRCVEEAGNGSPYGTHVWECVIVAAGVLAAEDTIRSTLAPVWYVICVLLDF
jgi:hypothetical protein